MVISENEILAAMLDAVRFSPPTGERCGQLQTFKVLERGGLLSAENLGATVCDLKKNWFWSRKWDNTKAKTNAVPWDYPILTVMQRNFTAERPLRSRGQISTGSYSLTVLDRYGGGCEKGNCAGCDGRTINDIYADTEHLLFQALSFLEGMVIVKVGADYLSMHEGELAKHVEAGDISEGSYEVTKHWGKAFAEDIKQAEGFKATIEALGLYGTSISINLPYARCYLGGYDFSRAKLTC